MKPLPRNWPKQSGDSLAREPKGLILDLRGNGGGYLEQSGTVANLFLKKGVEISSVRGRAGFQEVLTANDNPIAPTVPLVVLTDGRTASASEIVAGALQDHDRAVILGTTSFGKGLVQTVYPLEGGYALKMTTAKWYTPSGRSIQKERKLLPDGSFVEVLPDSMETDSVRKSSPKFKSDGGRIVYGGGAVTPDVIVQPDTLTTSEQKLLNALAPKAQIVRSTLINYAVEQKGKVQPGVRCIQGVARRVLQSARRPGRQDRESPVRSGRFGNRPAPRIEHLAHCFRRLYRQAPRRDRRLSAPACTSAPQESTDTAGPVRLRRTAAYGLRESIAFRKRSTFTATTEYRGGGFFCIIPA